MPFNPLAGKFASVTIGTTTYAFSGWSASIKNTLGKVTNFTGGGYAQFVPGITEAKITLEGPYDEGNMPFVVGNLYVLILGYTDLITLTVGAICETIEPTVDVEKEQRVKITFQSEGTFTGAIL